MSDGERSSASDPGDKGLSKSIPGAGLANSEWPATVAKGVDDVVSAIQDKAIRPILLAVRYVVYGVLILTMALLLMLFASIALIRVLDNYAFGHRVWASYALVGAILAGGGLFAWSKRSPRGSEAG
jgi:hypothetical protein